MGAATVGRRSVCHLDFAVAIEARAEGWRAGGQSPKVALRRGRPRRRDDQLVQPRSRPWPRVSEGTFSPPPTATTHPLDKLVAPSRSSSPPPHDNRASAHSTAAAACSARLLQHLDYMILQDFVLVVSILNVLVAMSTMGTIHRAPTTHR